MTSQWSQNPSHLPSVDTLDRRCSRTCRKWPLLDWLLRKKKRFLLHPHSILCRPIQSSKNVKKVKLLETEFPTTHKSWRIMEHHLLLVISFGRRQASPWKPGFHVLWNIGHDWTHRLQGLPVSSIPSIPYIFKTFFARRASEHWGHQSRNTKPIQTPHPSDTTFFKCQLLDLEWWAPRLPLVATSIVQHCSKRSLVLFLRGPGPDNISHDGCMGLVYLPTFFSNNRYHIHRSHTHCLGYSPHQRNTCKWRGLVGIPTKL